MPTDTARVHTASVVWGACVGHLRMARGSFGGRGWIGNVRKATGRGDTYRLWMRGILRGVLRQRERRPSSRTDLRVRVVPGSWKPDEPQLDPGCNKLGNVRCEVNRRGGERPRGRNESWRERSCWPEGMGFGLYLEWARARRDSGEATPVNLERGRNEVFGQFSVPVEPRAR
jgi:hypothetical protein